MYGVPAITTTTSRDGIMWDTLVMTASYFLPPVISSFIPDKFVEEARKEVNATEERFWCKVDEKLGIKFEQSLQKLLQPVSRQIDENSP